MITQENIPYTADEIKAMVKTCEKYNKARERARELQQNSNGMILKKWLWSVFPELKENEDERIRKEILNVFNQLDEGTTICGRNYDYAKWIAWLEKQGEKKPTDEVEPKFKIGNWITDGRLTCKVLGVTGKSYELHLHNDDYCHFETDIQSVNKYYHLWAIQDAEDGDVLVCEDENFTIPFIAIYKCLGDTVYNYKGLKDLTFNSHCFMGFNGNFYEGEGGHVIEGIHPGTKEQRNLLFQKMKEAGYEWDADKKELKKIEVASKESEDERIRKGLIKAVSRIFEGHKLYDTDVTREEALAWLEKQGEKKHIINVPSREVILSIWDLGNEWKELTNGCISTEYGTQLDYIQKHWHESEYYLKEKQGKQTQLDYEHADILQKDFAPIKTKFKVGDWIVTDDSFGKIIRHVDEISSNIIDERYGVSDEYGLTYNISFDKEHKWHKWTIQDAENGDVLATENFIFIFKNIDDGNGVHYYCQYEISKHEDDNQFDIALPQSLMGRVGNSISHYSPATKEQRDLLFQKMKEAGYEWNSEKKELKKIEVASKENEDEKRNKEEFGWNGRIYEQSLHE